MFPKATENLGRMLTDEEASRPINVNGVTTTLGQFLTFNDDGLSPNDVRFILDLDAGETVVLGGGAFAEFEVTRID